MGQVFSSFIENCNCGSSDNTKHEQDKEINKLHQSIREINRDIKVIKENHLHHIEQDINEMKTDIKLINNNINILLIRTTNLNLPNHTFV